MVRPCARHAGLRPTRIASGTSATTASACSWDAGPFGTGSRGRHLLAVDGARGSEQRLLECCAVASPDHIGLVHRRGRRTVPLVPRTVRVPLYQVAEVDVARAVRWLDEHWGGGVFIPDELRDVAAVA